MEPYTNINFRRKLRILIDDEVLVFVPNKSKAQGAKPVKSLTQAGFDNISAVLEEYGYQLKKQNGKN